VNTQNNENSISTYVKKHFDFLVDDYGFEYHPTGLGYKKDDLEIEFFHGKGEMDIVFFIRREDDIFKPYVSRLFELLSIIQRQKNEKIELPHDFPEYIISMEDVDKALSFYSSLAKKYCKEQFNGDFSLFKIIHLERRERV